MNDFPTKGPLLAPTTVPVEPDAHGQAALLLAESILHVLVETKSLSVEEALSVIKTSCEVKVQVAERAGESDRRMKESLGLLRAMFSSFEGYPR